MAVRSGEENVATLFADIHYFYGPPTVKPPHHRFDKGSYVYLFEDGASRRARVEIANNPGSNDQDAFSGYLDGCHIDYSFKHPTLVTITVSTHGAEDTNQWHLPTYDPRNETKYMYRLHTMDLYFWSKDDGATFLNALRRVLPVQCLTIKDEPVTPEPSGPMSAVVQKLEQVAIVEPTPQKVMHAPTISQHSLPSFPGPPTVPTPQSQTSVPSFAGPPTSGTPASQRSVPTFAPPPTSETPASQSSVPSFAPPPQESSHTFTPMAYNPAAPAAPEAITHREKTPPPDDGGNPLVMAATADHGHQPFSPSPYGPTTFAPPPSALNPQTLPHTQPPPSAGLQSQFSHPGIQRGMTFPMSPGLPSPSPYGHPAGFAPGVPGQPTHTQYANYPGSPGFAPSMQSPRFEPPNSPPAYNAPYPGQGFQGGYPQAAGHNEYNIHQQAYQPGEGEKMGYMKKTEPRGKLEERAAKLEKGVGGFLKKLEKRIG